MIIHVTVIVGLLLVMYYYRFTRKLLHWAMKPVGWFMGAERRDVKELEWVAKIDTFYAESLQLKQAKRKVIWASILTMVELLMYYSVPYFVLLSLHVSDVNIIEVMALHVMIVIITSIFPVPGGSGGAEYSFKTIFFDVYRQPCHYGASDVALALLNQLFGDDLWDGGNCRSAPAVSSAYGKITKVSDILPHGW